MFDLVIIGAGPAGLSAAIHAGRFGLNFVVLEKNRPGGQALAANRITNYPGFPEGIGGGKLMAKFIEQANRAGAKIKKCKAENISFQKHLYKIRTSSGEVSSRHVILATGLEPIKLSHPDAYYYPVPGEISHKGKRVLIIGGGDSAFDEAISFSKNAKSVTITMRSLVPKALPTLVAEAVSLGIKIRYGISEKEARKLKADVVVACIGKRQNLDILGRPRTPGIKLAGDALHPDIRHIAPAVGDGIRAVEALLRQSAVCGFAI